MMRVIEKVKELQCIYQKLFDYWTKTRKANKRLEGQIATLMIENERLKKRMDELNGVTTSKDDELNGVRLELQSTLKTIR